MDKLYKSGSYIYLEGDEEVNNVFILKEGDIVLRSINENLREYEKRIKPGDVFGFISALSNRPRMATAFAKTDSTVIVFLQEDILKMLYNNSQIAVKILNNFANELRLYNEMLFTLTKNSTNTKIDEKFYNIGNYNFINKKYNNAYYIFSKFISLYPESIYTENAKRILNKINEIGIKDIPKPGIDGKDRIYSDRQIIFCENEPGEELYIVKEGKVKIVKNSDDNEILLSILDEGSIFGELAIVSDKPRNATAFSHGKTVLQSINKDSLFQLLENSPELMKKIFISTAQRIWFTYIRIESKFYQKPLTRIYAFLKNKLIEEKVSIKSTQQYTFRFGIDELFKMADLDTSMNDIVMNEIIEDSNLNLNFGEITVKNPSILYATTQFHISRDHLGIMEKEQLNEEEEKKLTDQGNNDDTQIEDLESYSEFTEEEKEEWFNENKNGNEQEQISIERPYKAYEKVNFTIPEGFEKGLYEVYVEDENPRRLRFQQKMKPGQNIRIIFKRVGDATINIYCDKKQIWIIHMNMIEHQ